LLGIDRRWPPSAVFENEEEESFARQPFTPQVAADILRATPDSDITFLQGVERASDFILESLPIPPPSIRPAVSASTGVRARGQDEYTVKLQEIVKRSNELKRVLQVCSTDAKILEIIPDQSDMFKLGVPCPLERVNIEDPEIRAKYARLQMEVFLYANPALLKYVGAAPKVSIPAGVLQRKGLISKLKGKEGRIRGSLLGKRVDQSARSVITPSTEIDVDQVGVPEAIATTLTYPVRACSNNINQLKQKILKGAGMVGGAASIMHAGKTIYLSGLENRDIDLEAGAVVEVYLDDGDYVCFNRQPTLHKLGFLGHRVKVVKGTTFRLALPVTQVYNADFDGDEMNLHCLQSPSASAEAGMLLSVSSNCINPKSGRSSFGLVQDLLLSTYLMTRKVQYEACSSKRGLEAPAAVMHGIKFCTHHDQMSSAFPSSFSYINGSGIAFTNRCHEILASLRMGSMVGSFDEIEKVLCQKPVVILGGELLLGTLDKKMIGVGGEVLDCITIQGGGKACIQSLSLMQKIATRYMEHQGFSVGIKDVRLTKQEETDAEVDANIRSAIQSSAAVLKVTQSRPNVAEVGEATTLKILSRVLLSTAEVINKSIGDNNAFAAMASAGSKGSAINICQISGTLGQQIVMGKRVCSQRLLPCFSPDETSVNAHGFVKNNYYMGLEPTHFFFVCQSGREGLVDTAVKTASSGYLQRTLVKALEDCVVDYTSNVVNAQKEIIQFSYGNDGLSPTKVEGVKMDLFKTRSTWLEKYRVEAVRSLGYKHKLEQEQMGVRLAVNAGRILMSRFLGERVSLTKKEEIAWKKRITKFLSRFQNKVLKFHLAETLLNCPLLSRQEEEKVFREIVDKIDSSFVEPGEGVGLIGAQSLGEPATQLTLNSFHSAGTGASAGVLEGVPRLKELLSVTKKPKTPTLRLSVRNSDEGTLLDKKLSETHLDEGVEKVSILDFITFFDDDEKCRSLCAYRSVYGKTENECEEGEEEENALISVIFLRKTVLNRKEIKPSTICTLILETQEDIKVLACSSSSVPQPWIALQLRKEKMPFEHPIHHALLLVLTNRVISSCIISGVKGFVNTTLDKQKQEVVCVVDSTGDCFSTICRGLFGIDWRRVVPNSVHSVHQILGIEAAAAVLHYELTRTYASGGACNIDQRHVSLVVDTMCRTGVPVPFSRHGLNQTASKTGALVRASFEESVDVLVNASVRGEVDEVPNSLSAAIMVGSRPSVGTGAFSVLRPKSGTGGENDEKLVHTTVAGAGPSFTTCSLDGLAYLSNGEACNDATLLFSSPPRKRGRSS